ncbi:MAG: hypothetical protein C5S47_01300 [Candidatus Methanogasteraceae archaeon]|nr:MAG: hypothetical protein C5S47_01300 [ANME-2 cluster archaeon]
MSARRILMLALIGAIYMVGTGVGTVDTVEVRGTIEELEAAPDNLLVISNPAASAAEQGRIWDYSSFAGFWYDLEDNLETETLTILATVPAGETNEGDDTLNYDGDDRTIDENALIYRTAPEFQEYELHQDVAPTTTERNTQTPMEEKYDGDGVDDEPGAGDRLDLDIGLCVESDNPGGDCGYFIEGWMAEEYVAIDGNADELCKLLVEFEDHDKKTLSIGEECDLGGGFTLVANQIDPENDKVWFSLAKNGTELDNEVASTLWRQNEVGFVDH